MGKKAAAVVEEEKPKEVEKEKPVGEVLEGDFIFQDGSSYSGQYLKIRDEICLHGQGTLLTGPETFKGSFENGSYKEGRYTTPSGASYVGGFRGRLYHGVGEYLWPDGRAYKGTWKDGFMHGKGLFLNFSMADSYTGFSIDGRFASCKEEQEEMKQQFLTEYRTDHASSASAALKDLAARSTADGAPKEFFVPPQDDPDGKAELDAANDVVAGPFPAAAQVPQAVIQAFVARLEPGAENPLRVTVYEERRAAVGAVPPASASDFNIKRLKKDQLQCVGQCVEFGAADAGEASLSLVVLVNISRDYDVTKAKWKLVHAEEAAAQVPA